MQRSFSHEFCFASPPDEVFRLFDPQNEGEWASGWRIEPLAPQPFTTEPNAIFAVPHGDAVRELWTVLDFDPQALHAEYLAWWDTHLMRRIEVRAEPTEGGTRVRVSYLLTSLSRHGRQRLERYDEAFLAAWQGPIEDALARRRSARAS